MAATSKSDASPSIASYTFVGRACEHGAGGYCGGGGPEDDDVVGEALLEGLPAALLEAAAEDGRFLLLALAQDAADVAADDCLRRLPRG